MDALRTNEKKGNEHKVGAYFSVQVDDTEHRNCNHLNKEDPYLDKVHNKSIVDGSSFSLTAQEQLLARQHTSSEP